MKSPKPANMSGTVDKRFEGDQKENRQIGIATGTPYNSEKGNPATTISRGMVSQVHDENRKDTSGVLFDGGGARTMDSPVPEGAPMYEEGSLRTSNAIAAGGGAGGDTFSGVMSRGMDEHGESGDNEG